MNQSKVSGNNANPRKLSIDKTNDQNPLDLVTITVDPRLDDIESRNVLNSKAEDAKRMFANYRKNH
jgi:hypothetical protein